MLILSAPLTACEMPLSISVDPCLLAKQNNTEYVRKKRQNKTPENLPEQNTRKCARQNQAEQKRQIFSYLPKYSETNLW